MQLDDRPFGIFTPEKWSSASGLAATHPASSQTCVVCASSHRFTNFVRLGARHTEDKIPENDPRAGIPTKSANVTELVSTTDEPCSQETVWNCLADA